MRLEPYLKPGRTLILESAKDRDDVLRRLAEAAAGQLSGVDASRIERALLDREAQMATSAPEGVAFPHGLLPGLHETLVLVAAVRPAVAFGSTKHPPVDLVFAMFGPAEAPWQHLSLLARLARIAHFEGALDRLRACQTSEALLDSVLAEDRALC
ncbi:MAG: PTS sugar transporter subunit IIA [Phycisphaerales bacterium]|nr:MAG: PTS sugar transporter subunit IIA [Phycisphaerales bacterium]